MLTLNDFEKQLSNNSGAKVFFALLDTAPIDHDSFKLISLNESDFNKYKLCELYRKHTSDDLIPKIEQIN